jgi:hypothetical protein
MPEQACATRIDELSRQITGLQARHDELAHDDTQPDPLTDADLHKLQKSTARRASPTRRRQHEASSSARDPPAVTQGQRMKTATTFPAYCVTMKTR